jgi:hypothetical protein
MLIKNPENLQQLILIQSLKSEVAIRLIIFPTEAWVVVEDEKEMADQGTILNM